jgi:formylmethanofuran dehydrogenase subunit E
MECEYCALDGTAGEASVRCGECGEWVCEIHTIDKGKGLLLCPACFEAASDEIVEEDLPQDTEEVE